MSQRERHRLQAFVRVRRGETTLVVSVHTPQSNDGADWWAR